MLKKLFWSALIGFSITASGLACADTDPGVHQIYEAADAGHLAEAQRMVDKVLRDHPNSGKAHYVAAEVFARAGNLPRARDEMDIAEKLEPGLPFAKPASVHALRNELSSPRSGDDLHGVKPRRWLLTLALVVAMFLVAVIWLNRRRPVALRETYSQPNGSALASAPVAGPVGAAPGAVMPAYAGTQPGAQGIGSGIAGGLASGLAVGAGVVAGEELAHRLLDGNHEETETHRVASEPAAESQNPDLGGTDFGVSDTSSWDDEGGTQGGDDDNWT